MEDEQCSTHPAMSRTPLNVTKVKSILHSDQCLSVCLITDMVDLPKSDVNLSLQKIWICKKVCLRLVPKILTHEHKKSCMSICYELFDHVKVSLIF